jgi:hypothetical protein
VGSVFESRQTRKWPGYLGAKAPIIRDARAGIGKTESDEVSLNQALCFKKKERGGDRRKS